MILLSKTNKKIVIKYTFHEKKKPLYSEPEGCAPDVTITGVPKAAIQTSK